MNQLFLVQLIDPNGQVIKHESVKSLSTIESRAQISYSISNNHQFNVRITNLSSWSIEGILEISEQFSHFVLPAYQSRDFSTLEAWSPEGNLISVPIWKCKGEAPLERKISISAENTEIPTAIEKKNSHVIIVINSNDQPDSKNNKKLIVELIDSKGQVIDFESFEDCLGSFPILTTKFSRVPENHSKVCYRIDPSVPFSIRVTNRTIIALRFNIQVGDVSFRSFDLAPEACKEFFELKDLVFYAKQTLPIWKCFKESRKIFVFAEVFPDPSLVQKRHSKYSLVDWQELKTEEYGIVIEIN